MTRYTRFYSLGVLLLAAAPLTAETLLTSSATTTSPSAAASPAPAAPVLNSITAAQNPGTPGSAAAAAQPSAAQARQALIAGDATASQPTKWIKTGENGRDLARKEATFHLARAREAYVLKNYDQAGAEIRRANALLEIQQAALNSSRQQLEELAGQVQNGQIQSADTLEARFTKAMKAPDRISSEIPMSNTLYTAFRDEPRYHFDQARALYAKKDYNGASQEMQTAITYLQLEEDRAYGQKKVALQDAVNRLRDVAKDVKSGAAQSMARMDQAIQSAEQALAAS